MKVTNAYIHLHFAARAAVHARAGTLDTGAPVHGPANHARTCTKPCTARACTVRHRIGETQ